MKHMIVGGGKTKVVVACGRGPTELEQGSEREVNHLFGPDGFGCVESSDVFSLSSTDAFEGAVIDNLKLLQI